MATILIIGAAGKLGVPVAKELKKAFNVRVFDKDHEKLHKTFDESYERVAGDIFNEKCLKDALQGCYGVHINLSGITEQSGTEAIVKACLQLNIGRITYLSSSSVDEKAIWSPHARYKFFAEKTIMHSGIPYSIFCTSWFMEVIPGFIKNSRAFVYGKQPFPYHFIATADYARMVLRAYQNEKAANKRFIIHGTDGYLFKNAVAQYCAIIHPGIKTVETIPYWKARIITLLNQNPNAAKMISIMHFFEKAREKGDPMEAYELLGTPEFTLAKWVLLQKNLSEIHSHQH